MAVSRALRRLLGVLELEEEQARMALVLAAAELERMERGLRAMLDRERRGRGLVMASAANGELEDRLAGLEETRMARSAAAVLTMRMAGAEQETAARREKFLAKRVERRQAETLIRAAEAEEKVESRRRAQQSLDDWFLERKGRTAAREKRR